MGRISLTFCVISFVLTIHPSTYRRAAASGGLTHGSAMVALCVELRIGFGARHADPNDPRTA